jgi:hypothetical protein
MIGFRAKLLNDQQLLETLQDARAAHEKDYQWEKQHIGNGGSEIAAGRARRYADAIAIAAIRIGQHSHDAQAARSGPSWPLWALLAACYVAIIGIAVAECANVGATP